MTVESVTPDQIQALAFDAACRGERAEIERNPVRHTLHLTLGDVRYSAREAA